MSTSAENDRWLSKPWVLIGSAIAIAVAAYFVGYSKRADAPRDPLGEEVRRIAKEKEAETALVTGKRGVVSFIEVSSGKTIPACDKRSPGQEQCEFSVRKESDGKYVLVDSEGRRAVNRIYSETHIIDHEGGHCTSSSSSSGGHTTTNSNCCHSTACW